MLFKLFGKIIYALRKNISSNNLNGKCQIKKTPVLGVLWYDSAIAGNQAN
jgi:hypothetical protein